MTNTANKNKITRNDIINTRDISPRTIIEQALNKPGTISGCYSLFHNYSANNVASFAMQLKLKGLPIAPVMAGKAWVDKGYITEQQRIKMNSQRLYGLIPLTTKTFKKDKDGNFILDKNGNKIEEDEFLRGFKTCQAWLSSSQLNIKVKQDVEITFNETDTLNRLGLELIEWDTCEGNSQGYAIPNKKVIAINPLCTKRVDTFLHEVAHCLLHSKSDKIVDGHELTRSEKEVEAELTSYVCMVMLGIENEDMLSNARGYIQHWFNYLQQENKTFNSYGRVYKAVNTIMKAIGNHKGNFKASKNDFME